MSNTVQPMANAKNSGNAAKLHAKIKETWSKLGDDDIKLYDSNRAQFFSKLKEKQNVSKEDAMKKIQELEKACGCSSSTKAA
ncbi:MAG: hypothetical protein PHX61_13005 [Alphaproteobacteria bacterium]|nr:hypothetical protein [Alphaproteobacteria bacterium]OIN87815.1 MAG: hypothetical protein AUJ12_00480 [Alphaproteobacteria bacterium CG1_02_46_17]